MSAHIQKLIVFFNCHTDNFRRKRIINNVLIQCFCVSDIADYGILGITLMKNCCEIDRGRIIADGFIDLCVQIGII